MSDEIRAAGGLVVRDGEVLIVHRPRYEDWSLPKGKLDPGESWEQAALREVEEEAAVRCRLVRELPPVQYVNQGRPKRVRYWLMELVEDLGFTPNDEVDEVRWLTSGRGPGAAHLRARPRALARRRARLSGRSSRRYAVASSGRRSAQGRAASSCAPSESRVASSAGRPASCTASGSPSSPWNRGSEIAGWPDTLYEAV